MASNRGPVINEINLDIPGQAISFDVQAFNEAIETQGVHLVHYSALRCPVGMVDVDDTRRPHPDHEGCTNGFLYTEVGQIHGVLTNNSKHKDSSDMGFWDGSTVQCTFTQMYDSPCDTQIYVAPFDRFYLNEKSLVVPTWQLFIHHETGTDRLKYPVVNVQQLVDSSGQHYLQGSDFQVTNDGRIEWIGRRPVQNLDSGVDRGCVCSIRYTYRPYWYVGRLIHELRVSQTSEDGPRKTVRLPQAVVLHREYVPQSKDQQDPGSPSYTGIDADALRTLMSASNGGFGSK